MQVPWTETEDQYVVVLGSSSICQAPVEDVTPGKVAKHAVKTEGFGIENSCNPQERRRVGPVGNEGFPLGFLMGEMFSKFDRMQLLGVGSASPASEHDIS